MAPRIADSESNSLPFNITNFKGNLVFSTYYLMHVSVFIFFNPHPPLFPIVSDMWLWA